MKKNIVNVDYISLQLIFAIILLCSDNNMKARLNSKTAS